MTKHIWLPGVAGNYASTPDAVPLQITGDIDLRTDFASDDWDDAAGQYLVAKRDTGCYWYRVNPDGKLQAGFQIGAAADWTGVSTTEIDSIVADGERIQLRVTRTASSGAVAFYYKIGGDLAASTGWTADGVGSTDSGATDNNADELAIGARSGGASDLAAGKFYRAIVMDGIDGTIVYDADFTDESTYAADKSTLTEKSSNAATVTLNGDSWVFVDPIETGVLARAEMVLKTAGQPLAYGPNLVNPLADLSGNNHHAVLGSAVGADTNDPLALDYDTDGVQYLYLPGVTNNYVQTPDSAALSITGSIDLRCELAPDSWKAGLGTGQSLIAKYAGASSYLFLLTDAVGATLRLYIDDGGGAAFVDSDATLASAGLVDGERAWVRVTWNDATDTIQFFTSSDGSTWTQLGNDVSLVATGIADTAATVEVGSWGSGSYLTAGKYYRAQIYDGIAGTLVFDANFTDETNVVEPFATFTESSAQGATVTINRAATGVKAAVVDRNMFLLGTDDYLEVADAAGLDLDASTSMTWVAVIRAYGAGTYDIILSKCDGFTGLGWYQAITSSFDRIAAHVDDGVDAGDKSKGSELSSGVLMQTAGKIDRVANELRVVNNGVDVGNPIDTSAIGDCSNAYVLRIGAEGNAASDFLDGEFMGAAIFREALSVADIAQAGEELLGANFAVGNTGLSIRIGMGI